MKRSALLLALAALAGCSLFSGWSDLRGGRSRADAGGTPPADEESEASTGKDASVRIDAGSGADANVPPQDLPACAQAGDEGSCRCAGSCANSCARSGCVFVVPTGGIASNDCDEGGCVYWCEQGAQCTNGCEGGGCTFHCAASSQCVNDCGGGKCKFDCAPGACVNDCFGGNCTGTE